MKKLLKNKGFTLVEMLVVIAIIAVLVAIIVPVVSSATAKAKGATDAANLRSVLGQANALVMLCDRDSNQISTELEACNCKSVPNATLKIMYVKPSFFEIFYVNGDDYYGLDYFVDIAEHGASTLVTDLDGAQAGYENNEIVWYTVTNSAQEAN